MSECYERLISSPLTPYTSACTACIIFYLSISRAYDKFVVFSVTNRLPKQSSVAHAEFLQANGSLAHFVEYSTDTYMGVTLYLFLMSTVTSLLTIKEISSHIRSMDTPFVLLSISWQMNSLIDDKAKEIHADHFSEEL